MVLYLPKKRSASQPPSSGKKYTPITKVWNRSFARQFALAAVEDVGQDHA
jgi:hypothetical protein